MYKVYAKGEYKFSANSWKEIRGFMLLTGINHVFVVTDNGEHINYARRDTRFVKG